MKNLLTVSALLLLLSGTALAGSGYDSCIKEEKTLKAKEASECSGLRQLLNPSACYGTQKALKEYKAGKCRQIGTAENVDGNARAAIPEKKSSTSGTSGSTGTSGTSGSTGSTGSTGNTESTGSASTTVSPGNVGIVTEKKVDTDVPQQETTLEQLKEENARLKTEISRLKAENEQLRNAGR